MTAYPIKNADGSISDQEPEIGKWYCHMIILPNGRHVAGNIALWVDDGYDGEFINCGGEYDDGDSEYVDMVSDDFPDYLVMQ